MVQHFCNLLCLTCGVYQSRFVTDSKADQHSLRLVVFTIRRKPFQMCPLQTQPLGMWVLKLMVRIALLCLVLLFVTVRTL